MIRSVFEFYYKGVEKLNSGDYKGAIDYFSKEIALSSSLPDTLICRGYARYHLGDRDGALMDWLEAAEMGESDVYELIDKYFN
jgi:outer membrane protein assembly factor BamD (BamD/ComL family)